MLRRAALALAWIPSCAMAGVPEALIGRFVDGQGLVLAVERTSDGTLAATLGSDRGRAEWNGGSLLVRWESPPRALALDGGGFPSDPPVTEFSAGQDQGRLTLSRWTRTFVREGGSPWWRLRAATRADLASAFSSLAGRPGERAAFESWYETFYAGRLVERASALAEWTFGRYDAPRRLGFLALYAKLKAEDVWRHVGLVTYADGSGSLTFIPASVRALREGLSRRGYADRFLAGGPGVWGARADRRGAQLHFRGNDLVNVHLDFHNPVTLADLPAHLKHDYNDPFGGAILRGWTDEHKAARVAAEVRLSGIEIEFSPD